MFCPRCRADVAAELSTDNRRLLCARCSAELGMATGLARPGTVHQRSAEIQHEARELLARWKAESSPPPSLVAPVVAMPEKYATSDDPPLSGDAAVTWRIDDSHAGQLQAAPPATREPGTAAAEPEPRTIRPPQHDRKRRRRRRSEAARRSVSEFPVQPATDSTKQSPNWTMIGGQLCSYGGVGLSTCGTALVLWAYFGGPEAFAPSGWLLTTFGQMTLFLGVIMLVSGGMEQTQREVVHRIEQLGDRLLRMEFAHGPHDLPGPHFGRRRMSERNAESDPTDAETPVASD